MTNPGQNDAPAVGSEGTERTVDELAPTAYCTCDVHTDDTLHGFPTESAWHAWMSGVSECRHLELERVSDDIWRCVACQWTAHEVVSFLSEDDYSRGEALAWEAMLP